MRESVIEKAICRWAAGHGIATIKLAGPNNRGIPDRLFLKEGKAVFLEFKAPNKKPTALQEKRIRELNENGFPAMWCDNREEAKVWLTEVFKLDEEFEI